MITHELLVRTTNAAKEARDQGFDNTADAFDDVAENLLKLFNPSTQLEIENRTHLHTNFTHFN